MTRQGHFCALGKPYRTVGRSSVEYWRDEDSRSGERKVHAGVLPTLGTAKQSLDAAAPTAAKVWSAHPECCS